jgi:hypothetical protein
LSVLVRRKLFCLVNQLSGTHGEWTNGDDFVTAVIVELLYILNGRRRYYVIPQIVFDNILIFHYLLTTFAFCSHVYTATMEEIYLNDHLKTAIFNFMAYLLILPLAILNIPPAAEIIVGIWAAILEGLQPEILDWRRLTILKAMDLENFLEMTIRLRPNLQDYVVGIWVPYMFIHDTIVLHPQRVISLLRSVFHFYLFLYTFYTIHTFRLYFSYYTVNVAVRTWIRMEFVAFRTWFYIFQLILDEIIKQFGLEIHDVQRFFAFILSSHGEITEGDDLADIERNRVHQARRRQNIRNMGNRRHGDQVNNVGRDWRPGDDRERRVPRAPLPRPVRHVPQPPAAPPEPPANEEQAQQRIPRFLHREQFEENQEAVAERYQELVNNNRARPLESERRVHLHAPSREVDVAMLPDYRDVVILHSLDFDFAILNTCIRIVSLLVLFYIFCMRVGRGNVAPPDARFPLQDPQNPYILYENIIDSLTRFHRILLNPSFSESFVSPASVYYPVPYFPNNPFMVDNLRQHGFTHYRYERIDLSLFSFIDRTARQGKPQAWTHHEVENLINTQFKSRSSAPLDRLVMQSTISFWIQERLRVVSGAMSTLGRAPSSGVPSN